MAAWGFEPEIQQIPRPSWFPLLVRHTHGKSCLWSPHWRRCRCRCRPTSKGSIGVTLICVWGCISIWIHVCRRRRCCCCSRHSSLRPGSLHPILLASSTQGHRSGHNHSLSLSTPTCRKLGEQWRLPLVVVAAACDRLLRVWRPRFSRIIAWLFAKETRHSRSRSLREQNKSAAWISKDEPRGNHGYGSSKCSRYGNPSRRAWTSFGTRKQQN
jgi:hypothetical protein